VSRVWSVREFEHLKQCLRPVVSLRATSPSATVEHRILTGPCRSDVQGCKLVNPSITKRQSPPWRRPKRLSPTGLSLRRSQYPSHGLHTSTQPLRNQQSRFGTTTCPRHHRGPQCRVSNQPFSPLGSHGPHSHRSTSMITLTLMALNRNVFVFAFATVRPRSASRSACVHVLARPKHDMIASGPPSPSRNVPSVRPPTR